MIKMSRINPDVDIIKDVLEAVLKAQPLSSFTQSLLQQYTERGGLSKKQLQGLYSKAQNINTISTAKLATLEAIILRKHSKHKSELPENTPLYSKNEANGKMIESILAKYPQHKRVLFLKSKYDNNEPFNTAEQLDLEKFTKLLIK
jgi:DNA repair protein RadC